MRRAAWLCSLALLVASPKLQAAPTHQYGFGARATALGGAVSADAGNAASLFYNPAQLSLAPESQLALGYRGVSPALQTDQQDTGAAGLHSLDGALLGRGQFLGIPVGFGLGLALTNGHLSRVESVRPDEPRWVLKETLPELLELRAALSLRPTPWLSLGGGAGFLATTRGGFEVTGNAIFADDRGAEYDSQLRHSVAAELLSSRYLVLGAQLRLPTLMAKSPAPIAWSLGLAFRDEAALNQQLQGTLRGNVDAGFLQVPVQYRFDAHSLVAFQPRQLVLGVSAQRQAWRANVDLGFEQWSRYPSPVARSAAHIEADVPAGLPLALPPNTELPAPASAGFQDRLTWRAGVERSLGLSGSTELLLRAGYAYMPSPAPRTSDDAQLLDASEHVFSLGTGIALRRLARWLPHQVELDAFGLYGHLPNRRLERQGRLFQAKGRVVSAGLTLQLSLGTSSCDD
jgi:hypothetical protein